MSNVHFILDEAAMLGNMRAIDDALGIGRAYSIRLQLYYQSIGQIRKCFPDGQEQSLFSNTSQILFGVNDNATAEYVSTHMGEHTIVVTSGGSSHTFSQQSASGPHSSGSTSQSTSNNHNWQQQARKLLKPEEVIALSPRIAIAFTPGVPPLCIRLLRYYEEEWLNPSPSRLKRRIRTGFQLIRSVLWCVVLLIIATCLTITLQHTL